MKYVFGYLPVNEYSLYFFYGITFVLTGFTLAMKVKNNFKIGNRVWLLAGFGIVHGSGELLHSWLLLQRTIYQSVPMPMVLVEQVLLTTSFTMLFFFGIELILLVKPRWRILRAVPAVLFIAWMGYFVGWEIADNDAVGRNTIYLSAVTARYFLGFPSAITTMVGLYLQLRTSNYIIRPDLKKYLKLGAVSFGIYGVMTGLFVRPGNFFPANVINSHVLYTYTGIPVEIYRMACAVSIAFSIIKTLQVIDAEIVRRLEKAEINQAVCKEKEKISRDLHDGVLQTIFSVGLRLEKHLVSNKGKMRPEDIEDLEFSLTKLNNAMDEIRRFINQLSSPGLPTDIKSILEEYTEEFSQYEDYSFHAEITGRPVNLDGDKLINIYYFLKEVLSNARKHSYAKHIGLEISFTSDRLLVTVKDDGIGIRCNVKHKGMGLKNMYSRARELNGQLSIKTGDEGGTEVILDIPI